MSPQYNEHRPTSHWDLLASLGHPCKFQCVSRLGSVTARHSSSGRQPNFAALNRGRHLYSAGRPSRWALAHICSYLAITFRRERITSNKLKHMYKYNYTTFFNITSLDLNIIENVWHIIKLKLQSETEVIKTRAKLIDTVCRIWRSHPAAYIQNLYASIPRGLHSITLTKGFPTKYWTFELWGKIPSFCLETKDFYSYWYEGIKL